MLNVELKVQPLRDADWDRLRPAWRFKNKQRSDQQLRTQAFPCFLTVLHNVSSHSSQLLSPPPSLPFSHPNRWDLQKNQFPLPGGEAQCFTAVSDWWRADAISHPAAFYSTSELVAIQRIFMANNNRRCNSYSPRWVNLSRETRGWPTRTAGGQNHVNKLLRLNDWLHGCEEPGAIQQSDVKAVSEIAGIQSKAITTSTTLILQSFQLLI